MEVILWQLINGIRTDVNGSFDRKLCKTCETAADE
jgi:hypothetical protein